ncbi:hypothetical protein HN873_060163 [Arachis hypogaea]
MKVPRVESKLRVFSFKIQFLSQVRKSVKLKIMKKILFGIHNWIQDFKLDSLFKLTDTRASNNKMTLMHYLCKVLADRSPGLLDFHLDLVSMEAVTKVMIYAWLEKENYSTANC